MNSRRVMVKTPSSTSLLKNSSAMAQENYPENFYVSNHRVSLNPSSQDHQYHNHHHHHDDDDDYDDHPLDDDDDDIGDGSSPLSSSSSSSSSPLSSSPNNHSQYYSSSSSTQCNNHLERKRIRQQQQQLKQSSSSSSSSSSSKRRLSLSKRGVSSSSKGSSSSKRWSLLKGWTSSSTKGFSSSSMIVIIVLSLIMALIATYLPDIQTLYYKTRTTPSNHLSKNEGDGENIQQIINHHDHDNKEYILKINDLKDEIDSLRISKTNDVSQISQLIQKLETDINRLDREQQFREQQLIKDQQQEQIIKKTSQEEQQQKEIDQYRYHPHRYNDNDDDDDMMMMRMISSQADFANSKLGSIIVKKFTSNNTLSLRSSTNNKLISTRNGINYLTKIILNKLISNLSNKNRYQQLITTSRSSSSNPTSSSTSSSMISLRPSSSTLMDGLDPSIVLDEKPIRGPGDCFIYFPSPSHPDHHPDHHHHLNDDRSSRSSSSDDDDDNNDDQVGVESSLDITILLKMPITLKQIGLSHVIPLLDPNPEAVPYHVKVYTIDDHQGLDDNQHDHDDNQHDRDDNQHDRDDNVHHHSDPLDPLKDPLSDPLKDLFPSKLIKEFYFENKGVKSKIQNKQLYQIDGDRKVQILRFQFLSNQSNDLSKGICVYRIHAYGTLEWKKKQIPS